MLPLGATSESVALLQQEAVTTKEQADVPSLSVLPLGDMLTSEGCAELAPSLTGASGENWPSGMRSRELTLLLAPAVLEGATPCISGVVLKPALKTEAWEG